MSRFFDKTNRAARVPSSVDGTIDLDQAMTAVKQKVGRAFEAEAGLELSVLQHSNEASSHPPLGGVNENATLVIASSALRLPRSEATLLLAGREVASPQAVEAFERLRNRLMRQFNGNSSVARSVVISSAEASEGKTFVTANLALSAAKVHKTRVLLVDADVRIHGLTDLLGAVERPGLAEVLAGTIPFEAASLATDVPELFMVGAGSSSGLTAELFSSPRWKAFVAWASQTFELVLVDSPPILHVADSDLIAAVCSKVLLVVRAQQTRREALEKAVALIDAHKLAGIIFNGANGTNQQNYYNRYYQQISAPNAERIPVKER